MTDDRAHRFILARRRRFIAAALASVGLGAPVSCGPTPTPTVGKATTAGAPTSTAAPIENDRDHDGVLDVDDKCPDEPEDRDGVEDEDGCPEADFDKDGIPDVNDACPKDPGKPSPNPQKHGCPQMCLSISVSIKITQVVLFVSGKDAIDKQSLPILDEVVAVLKAHPEMALDVQGHTDSKEASKLGASRATNVMMYLVDKGIDASRLTSKGFGSASPIATNDTEEGRARNRRVAFVRTDPGP